MYFVSGKRAEKVHSCLKTFKSQTDKIRGYRTVLSDDFCAFEIQCSDNVCASVTINTHSIGGRFEFEFSVTGLDGRLVVRGLDLYGSRKDSPQEELLLKQRTEGEGEGEEGEMEVEGIDGIRRVPIAMGAHCTAAACGSMQSHQRAGFKEMFLALRMAFESTAASASMRPGVFTWGGGGGGGAVATGEAWRWKQQQKPGPRGWAAPVVSRGEEESLKDCRGRGLLPPITRSSDTWPLPLKTGCTSAPCSTASTSRTAGGSGCPCQRQTTRHAAGPGGEQPSHQPILDRTWPRHGRHRQAFPQNPKAHPSVVYM